MSSKKNARKNGGKITFNREELGFVNKIRMGGRLKKVKKKQSQILVIGAGAWGSAIANLIARNGNEVQVFSHNSATVKSINEKKFSPRLNGVIFPDNVTAIGNLKASLKNSDFIFIVTPSNEILKTFAKFSVGDLKKRAIFVLCSKGVDEKTGRLFSDIIKEKYPSHPCAVLSGPNFAMEVANNLPTITTVAANKKAIAIKVAALLFNDRFLPIISDDVATVQICGAVKNILAIACGIIDGLNLGENAKAALITKGVGEIMVLAQKMKGAPKTLLSAAGIGDIFLTCSTAKSRNNSLGVKIGQGENPAQILGDQTHTYEGAKSARAVLKLAARYNLHLPICGAVAKILYPSNRKIDVEAVICQAIFG